MDISKITIIIYLIINVLSLGKSIFSNEIMNNSTVTSNLELERLPNDTNLGKTTALKRANNNNLTNNVINNRKISTGNNINLLIIKNLKNDNNFNNNISVNTNRIEKQIFFNNTQKIVYNSINAKKGYSTSNLSFTFSLPSETNKSLNFFKKIKRNIDYLTTLKTTDSNNLLLSTNLINNFVPTFINNPTLLLNNSVDVNNQSDNFKNNNSLNMFVIDKKSMELLPLKDIPKMLLLALSMTFMVIGGAIPYVFQYIEIYRRKSAIGFSLLVCLALCLANILRILFWFGKHFETTLLVQSIVMIICMFAMLEISVRMNKKSVPPMQRATIWNGNFFTAFWKWNDLSSFIFTLFIITVISSIITAIFIKHEYYIEALGMISLLVEACLGLPQLLRNFKRRSVTGMSVKMVIMWLLGDVGKTIYFVIRNSPTQFYICSCLQITIDVLILIQVFIYGKNLTGCSRVPSTST